MESWERNATNKLLGDLKCFSKNTDALLCYNKQLTLRNNFELIYLSIGSGILRVTEDMKLFVYLHKLLTIIMQIFAIMFILHTETPSHQDQERPLDVEQAE